MENPTSAHDAGAAQRFSQLSTQEQVRYRKAALQMVRLAQQCAIPIIFAPPLSCGGALSGATGCLLELNERCFFVTASHVLLGYEERRQSGEALNWQVGALPPFDPLCRISWRDHGKDLVFLELSASEANVACADSSRIVTASAGWPPPCPRVGQLVFASGYPKVLREVAPSGRIGAGPYSAMFRVTTVGSGYFYCQIEPRELISFNEMTLPPPDTDFGGLSGGPVLLDLGIVYPLIGLITEHCSMASADLQFLKIATLDSVREEDLHRDT